MNSIVRWVLLQGWLISEERDRKLRPNQGRIQDFKLGGALKKNAPSGGRREIFGVFRVKNRDFMPKIIFFPILGEGARRVRPPGSAPANKRTLVPQPQPWNRNGTPQSRKSYVHVLLILYNRNSLGSVEFNVYSLIYLCILSI